MIVLFCSEEKAKLLRRICGEINEKNEELETCLASMQLDSLSLDDSSEALPQVCEKKWSLLFMISEFYVGFLL